MFLRLLMQDFAAFVTGQMDVGSEGEKEESSYRDASASKNSCQKLILVIFIALVNKRH